MFIISKAVFIPILLMDPHFSRILIPKSTKLPTKILFLTVSERTTFQSFHTHQNKGYSSLNKELFREILYSISKSFIFLQESSHRTFSIIQLTVVDCTLGSDQHSSVGAFGMSTGAARAHRQDAPN